MPYKQPLKFSLFGIQIDNVTMKSAVELVLRDRSVENTKTFCFVNVNTLNLAKKHEDLNDAVNDADWVFADGSGVRMASRRQGVELRENVNGTDMLPILCENAAKTNKGLFLLGAEPGVAEQMARNLEESYLGLEICGVHHGYFDQENCDDVIEEINASGAQVLLVAFGSPIQERWLKTNRSKLKVTAALAVGGLFDFYSGRIPRAPLWMRENGIEWIWRLIQEPKNKFHRYVIGNPVFIWRCFWQLKKAY